MLDRDRIVSGLKRYLSADQALGAIRRASFWVLVLHLLFWLAVAMQSLGFRFEALGLGPIWHWPGTGLSGAWWLAYIALVLAIASAFFLCFFFVFERGQRRLSGLLLVYGEPGFWTFIRSNALGLALAFAFSFGSLSVSHWFFEYLYELPERRLAGTVVAETELPPVSSAVDPVQLSESLCLDQDRRSDSLQERCERWRDELILRLEIFTALGSHLYEVIIIFFHLHAALMMIVYFALCRHLSGLGNRSYEAVQS